MTLILSNDDVGALLTMEDIIAALEPAYVAIAEKRAIAGARTDVINESPYDANARYWLKAATGVVPDLEIGTVRINSDVVTWPEEGGKRRRVKLPLAPGGRWTGLVLMFSARTGEPLAIFPDGAIQQMRVAGSTGLSIKHMARADAATLGLIGSGGQARTHLLAALAVRPIERVQCYSATPANRERFSAEMSAETGVEVVAASSAKDAVKGADVVITATNSLDAVFFADWIEAGQHLATIRYGEIEPAVLRRADVLAIHDPGNLGGALFHAPEGLEIPDLEQERGMAGDLEDMADLPTLAEVVAGQRGRRASADEVTLFLNYHGLGFQFTATGAAFYNKAVAAGRGHELPTEWFTEDILP